MSKSEKKAEPGEGKNGKKRWIIVGVVAVLVLAAAVGGKPASASCQTSSCSTSRRC